MPQSSPLCQQDCSVIQKDDSVFIYYQKSMLATQVKLCPRAITSGRRIRLARSRVWGRTQRALFSTRLFSKSLSMFPRQVPDISSLRTAIQEGSVGHTRPPIAAPGRQSSRGTLGTS
ncbi:hypothetical protein IscW_ISCW010761 [Ixodes scapularis]|uniref:Uncharacterized protein n=1 Tax=Ixodes scapularis TaxID=6945 RepID=B7Q652_IXOSC|nr:hypothetical protein IscW_ISCW010761 [Ixodes scapularis]|eukprot:XP_002402734.1 hypothetical protein IscW_ISCW010761 [Ixodes scapularis]